MYICPRLGGFKCSLGFQQWTVHSLSDSRSILRHAFMRGVKFFHGEGVEALNKMCVPDTRDIAWKTVCAPFLKERNRKDKFHFKFRTSQERRRAGRWVKICYQ